MSLAVQQRRLTALGFYSGRADGIYGPGTDAAIDAVLDIIEKQRGVVPAPKPVVSAVDTIFPANFDPDYRWLEQKGTLPRILSEMIRIYGTKEMPGAANNPVIMGWARELGLEKVYASDATAWCGLAMTLAVHRAGYDVVAGPLWALNWGNFGVKADVPSLGDILTFARFDAKGKQIGGHVGQYLGEDDQYYHVIGGNTQDSVTIGRLLKSRLRHARRPAYKNPLPSWKPYRLTSGGVISSNEA